MARRSGWRCREPADPTTGSASGSEGRRRALSGTAHFGLIAFSGSRPTVRPVQRTLAKLLSIALVLAACGQSGAPASSISPASSPSAAGGLTRTSEGGGVTVVATWGGPAAGLRFDLKLDTHSVDLDALDLSDAVLRNDRGGVLRAPRWLAPPGGHHRQGPLVFDGDARTFLDAAAWIELDLPGIGDTAERVLRWTIGPAS